MSLFSCCPKKPKMSLDYIIKWIEDADKTIKYLSDSIEEIKEMDLQKVFDDYARDEYDWSQVPEFDAKADKVENVVAGNLASLDSDGNLQDSGKKPADFALVGHSHNAILDAGTESNISIDEGTISIVVEGGGSGGETEINADNIGNLHRALMKPDDVPTQGSNNLITSEGVYNYKPSCIEDVVEERQYAKVYADNHNQGDPNVIIELTDNNIPGSPVTKSTIIGINNIDNLNLALEGPDTTPISGSGSLITSGGVYSQLENIRQSLTHRIETIEELFNSLNERVSNLENPQYSDTGIVITNNRYDNKVTTNTTVYNELQIGDQAKVEIEYQDGKYSDTLYVTVVDKMTGPFRTIFDKDIYTTNVTGVTLYKRIS